MEKSEEQKLSYTLQQRADYIPIDDLLNETSEEGKIFNRVFAELTNKGLRTIVGPRGCGKTHMMRYAWLKCNENVNKPFAIYVSFNRYFRLEPLLSSRGGAINQFHSWVLARILLAIVDKRNEWKSKKISNEDIISSHGFKIEALSNFVSKVERAQPLEDAEADIVEKITIEKVQSIIDEIRYQSERSFTIILMDDAALTLTPDYLLEFLDIVRSLKSTSIIPKASVYPGTTEKSPKFHEGQDAISIPVWISVDDHEYDQVMNSIALKRVPDLDRIPDDAKNMFKLAAFGIPRAYLTMLDEFSRGVFKNTQQAVNTIIKEHYNARLNEYRSLSIKVPKFRDLISFGEIILDKFSTLLKDSNVKLLERKEKQLYIGIEKDGITPIVERMFNLLVEAGLIYDSGEVNHGTPQRIYRRFIPHTALLINLRVFSNNEKSSAIKQVLDGFSRKNTKHPLRRSLTTLINKDKLNSLSFSLPECQFCHTSRISDNQKFCHQCGNQLVDASTFNLCLDTKLDTVPGLTKWQKAKINESLPTLKTIRDYLAKQDPAADFLAIKGIGDKRATRIIDVLESFVNDFLS
ncbi:zinc ribbon domain-containing protein [Escherichia coli]|uniref:ORC-CDC6 family AAA ATPase n=1 Tax=Escherichia coli TaxID=562 RepID=UPI00192BB831|nr:zinc ribbon domain-containing protein [Escherichia coli]EKR5135219.1 zinc ribbon domain-containing protein [Escherichia coli]MBL4041760.1 zinc ribbon domain-containing protein [Escherichia coli]MBL4085548.1 zinc ribbon domain-containing protein [Escherichia coli]MCV5078649.1 zinc ribbon domain-containing protein [Escherichia coli]MCV5084320.1 zinc ribbon domain-containing protein [Escherichia coli]